MVELGKIERPSVESFSGKRKLYCVPNVYPLKDAPDDYKALVERYWDEAGQQVEKLESAGKIRKIFCESIAVGGEDAFDILKGLNEHAFKIIQRKAEDGALVLPLEQEEIFGPFLDWANCLNVVRTHEVFTRVLAFYQELSQKRSQHAGTVIEGNLSSGEAGLLIMRDEDRVRLQFAPDIEVFLVTPPSYDDILKWMREKIKEFSP